jgi:hypothetical protein
MKSWLIILPYIVLTELTAIRIASLRESAQIKEVSFIDAVNRKRKTRKYSNAHYIDTADRPHPHAGGSIAALAAQQELGLLSQRRRRTASDDHHRADVTGTHLGRRKMSIITILSGSHALVAAMPLKTLSVSIACAGVIFCCASYHAAPAALATQAPMSVAAGPTSGHMIFVKGTDSEPPAWPDNFARAEPPRVVVASAAPVQAMRAHAAIARPLPVAPRLVPHAVTIKTAVEGPAVAIDWNR